MTEYDGIVLAGGESRRLGGVDKALLQAGGRSFLDCVLDAMPDAGTVVVAGPARPTLRPVRFCREDPAGGGPVAGLASALSFTSAGVLVVVAVDVPLVGTGTVARLLEAVAEAGEAAVLVDTSGREQPLVAAYRRAALDRALDGLGAGSSMRSLLARLEVMRVPDVDEVCVDGGTWEGVARVRRRLEVTGTMWSRPTGTRRTEADMLDEQVLEAWVRALAQELGVDYVGDTGALLAVARDAAHNVDRPAAPLTTFLVGYAAGLQGGDAAIAREAGERASRLALQWPERTPQA